MFTHAEPVTGDVSTTQKEVPAYAWVVFVLTVGLLLSDYMSRQVLNAVFPMLKATWHLSDTRLGSLSSVVALMVGLLTFPLSVFADREEHCSDGGVVESCHARLCAVDELWRNAARARLRRYR